MFYEAELRLLRETFRKCRIQTTIVDVSISPLEHPELKHYGNLSQHLDKKRPLRDYLPPLKNQVIYRLTDSFDCQYIYFQLPEFPKQSLFVIGPFLYSVPTRQQIMEWSEGENVSPDQLHYLELFYSSIPLLQEHSHLFILLDAFAEHLWGYGNYHTEEVNLNTSRLLAPVYSKKGVPDEKDTLLAMKNLEQRYAYENQLMDAVSKGQTHKADLLFSGISTFALEQRVQNPVANIKNYCIIMNTLLRKAAERGGVHPLYLDNTSSLFASRIENILSVDAVSGLMPEMFRAYCRLVRKHNTKDYSPPIQKAIIYVEANLADNLTLRSLAQALNISGSYLSTLFKKETGQTLTDYINTRRIHQAMHLLDTTRLQIQTVAQHCGIMDVQYFSKLFKRISGVSPRQYRQFHKP